MKFLPPPKTTITITTTVYIELTTSIYTLIVCVQNTIYRFLNNKNSPNLVQ